MDSLYPHVSNCKTAFIYALIDPNTEQIRYIGKANNPLRRLRDHLNDGHGTHKCRWIKGLLVQGKTPTLQLIEEVPWLQWKERERYWIAYYRELGCKLTNATIGGEGTQGHTLSADQCLKVSQSRQRRNVAGERQYSKRNQSSVHYQLSLYKAGESFTEAQKEQIKALFLTELSCSGRIVNSCQKAGVSRDTIYNWRRMDEDFSEKWVHAVSSFKKRPIQIRDTEHRRCLQDAFLQSFESTANVRLSASSIGISRDSIYRWLDNDTVFKKRFYEIKASLEAKFTVLV